MGCAYQQIQAMFHIRLYSRFYCLGPVLPVCQSFDDQLYKNLNTLWVLVGLKPVNPTQNVMKMCRVYSDTAGIYETPDRSNPRPQTASFDIMTHLRCHLFRKSNKAILIKPGNRCLFSEPNRATQYVLHTVMTIQLQHNHKCKCRR